MRVPQSLWGLAQRVRVAPEPGLPPKRMAFPAPAVRPTLPATATRFEQVEQAVWAHYRPIVCAAVSAALADAAAVQRAAARAICCGHPMRRHDARAVTWQTWVGHVHVTVDRYRCRHCRTDQRPLLAVLGVEPGRVSGWLARHLALLGSVVPYALAAEVATPLLGVRTHAMTVWRAVQRLGAAAQTYTNAVSAYHAQPTSVAPVAAAMLSTRPR